MEGDEMCSLRLESFLLLITAISLGACSATKKSLDPPPPPAAPAPLQPGTAGIRHLDQLALSMSAVTQVPMTAAVTATPSNTTIAAHNGAIAPWLSTDGNVLSVTPSMLLSVTGLAGSFCQVFLINEAAMAAGSRRAHGSVNFKGGPPALTGDIIADVISHYAHLFWHRDPTATEMEALIQSVTEATTGVGAVANSDVARTAAVQSILIVPCTATLSSLAFLAI
jgi:hypothetical protein